MDSQPNKPPERSFKEQRIRELTMIHYSQPEVKKALYQFSQNRESIPRYYEGFGKRPDTFQYESDILEQVRRGATSFHCSEELWSDPLELTLDLSKDQLDELRIGWDLLLDIDSPYLEYSKIYTKLLVEALKFHGIENLGVKFSGSKGFHLIIPWKAFPEKIYNQFTKDMFPQWPRIICEYLSEMIKPKLSEEIFQERSLKELAEQTGKKESEILVKECASCNREASKKYLITWICEHCKNLGELIKIDNKRIIKCPECRKELIEKSRKEILFCEYCNFNSEKNPEMFGIIKKIGMLAGTGVKNTMGDQIISEERHKTETDVDTDLILVVPRHLFRMPYSLHEKTALASIVIDKDQIENFQITDAKPFKSKIKNFYPTPKPEEARELILQALDWHEQKEKEENIIQGKKEQVATTPALNKPRGEFKKIEIPNPSKDIYPPQIKLLLEGIKQDGRKRALMILISFFKSLGVPDIEVEKKVLEWNELNYQPIKKGYIISQLNWYKKNPNRLPPNFNNPIYKDLGVDKPDQLALQTKNPVSYAVKKYFMLRK